MRLVLADDAVLLREGLVRMLLDAGHEVAAAVGDAPSLLAAVAEHQPDLAIVDVRMPPTFTDEGARAAVRLRADHPLVGVLVLSQQVEPAIAEALRDTRGFGYLLKDRVLDVPTFLDASRRVAAGGSVLDAAVIEVLIERRDATRALADLTGREREILALMAEGLSNAGIGKRLWLADRTVETHVSNILGKLGLPRDDEHHRRVGAVVAYLTARGG